MKLCTRCGRSSDEVTFRGGPVPKAKGRRDYVCLSCLATRRKERIYDLDEGGFEELIAKCGGVCQICGEASVLHVDHDHGTGQPRGMLCQRCNMGLGCLGDSAAGLRRALSYVERS